MEPRDREHPGGGVAPKKRCVCFPQISSAGNKHVLHTIDIGLFLDSFLKTGTGAVATGGYTRD
mgnify:CR=1 FL=1